MADAAVQRFGAIDVAILAAGMPVVGTIEELSADDWQTAIGNNFLSSVYFIREMARRMNDNGAIVLVAAATAA